MYGYRLRIFIWTLIAVSGTAYLTFFSPEPSWSENATKVLHYLLNISLLAIADVFNQIANSEEGQRKFYKWIGKEVRLEHLARYTKYGFFAILIFHMGHEYLPVMLHLVATAWGVSGVYLITIRAFKTWSFWWWTSIIGSHAAVVSLIFAFGFEWLPVKDAEFAILVSALPVIIGMITNKNKK